METYFKMKVIENIISYVIIGALVISCIIVYIIACIKDIIERNKKK